MIAPIIKHNHSNKYTHVLMLICLCFILQCQQDYEPQDLICNETQSNSASLNYNKTVYLLMDSVGIQNKYKIFYDDQLKKDLLVSYDHLQHRLTRVDIDSLIYYEAISFEKDGPNAIPFYFDDFYYFNQDSFLIASEHQGFNFLNVVDGKVEKITIQTTDFDLTFDTDYNARLEYNPKTQNYFSMIYTLKTNTGEGDYFSYDYMGEVDLNRKELVKTYGKYPFPHSSKPLGYSYIPSIVYPGDSIVVAFGAVNHITVYDQLSGTPLRDYCVQSIYEPMDNLPTYNPAWVSQKMRNYWTENGHFLNFYYDSYRNLFYRFVRHGQELKNGKGELNGFYDGEWSVIIIDSDLSVINELKFMANQYDPYEIIITRKGIYIENIQKTTDDATAWDFFEVEVT